MVSSPETLRARAIYYRRKAAEMREDARRHPAASEDFLKLAGEYQDLADQLEAIANDAR